MLFEPPNAEVTLVHEHSVQVNLPPCVQYVLNVRNDFLYMHLQDGILEILYDFCSRAELCTPSLAFVFYTMHFQLFVFCTSCQVAFEISRHYVYTCTCVHIAHVHCRYSRYTMCMYMYIYTCIYMYIISIYFLL